MRFLSVVLLLSACSSKWNTLDLDGDGVTVAEGDCFEGEGGEGTYPGASDTPYDGIDQDCSGGSDYDADGDGHDAVEHGGDDCWDLPGGYPDGFVAVPGQTQLEPGEVYPGAIEIWYDGIDGDCSGGSDFDQDGDGADSSFAEQVDGSYGDDCYDVVDPSCDTYDDADVDCAYPRQGELVGEPFAPEDIHPGATDTWYDGTNQDCDTECHDYDQDCDSFVRSEECDDTDASVYPDDSVDEVWGNCVDENCDGNFADQDFDGWLASGVEGDCPDALDEDDLRYLGDCYDDPAEAKSWQALDGYDDPAADDVHPEAYDQPYDGLDGDCGGGDDFDADGDGYRSASAPDASGQVGDDCDDTRADVNPGALDAWYDGLDADCAGNDDYDQDLDGFLDPSGGGDDCVDTDPDINPGERELCSTPADDDCSGSDNDADAVGCSIFYRDVDGDGHAGDTSECFCEASGAYTYTSTDDCDDDDALIYPGATERCATDGVDDDCDGSANDLGASGCTTRYYDADGDGHGTTATECRCDPAGDYDAPVGDDCRDTDATAYPGAPETCDTVDDDCDGTVDDGLTLYYLDADRDGRGSSTDAGNCSSSGRVSSRDDCNDSDATVYTGAPETCDGVDDDCDGTIDDGLTTYYTDGDRDGYGSGGAGCTSGTGRSLTNNDCDDADATVYPGATETCDSDDEDCDGSTDEGLPVTYTDSDRDGYGSGGAGCATGTGRSSTNNDCNDANAAVNPGATETCATATTDDDCDGSTNDLDATACTEWYYDADNDGYGTSVSECRCTASGTYRASATDDCNDSSASISPGDPEVCNSVDDDCDGTVDDGVMYYRDADGDGYGAGAGGCVSGAGYVTNNTDCDDTDPTVYPSAPELCDGQYNNCSTSSSWTTATENGKVSWESLAGAWSATTVSTASSSTTTLTASADGTWHFCPGTYYVRVANSGGYDIHLEGQSAATTILDANGSGAALSISAGGTSTATGLTFQNGGGVSVVGQFYGGSVYVYAASAPADPTLSMTDCVISDSQSGTAGNGNGGGLGVRGAAWVDLVDTDITGNTGGNGGGVGLTGTGLVSISGGTISGNAASTGGGGVAVVGAGSITLTDVQVTQNDASLGGGVYAEGGSIEMVCGSGTLGVYNNDSTTRGGGGFATNDSASVLLSDNCDWGSGGSDNNCTAGGTGDDVDVQTGATTYESYSSYGNDESFTCTGGAKGECL